MKVSVGGLASPPPGAVQAPNGQTVIQSLIGWLIASRFENAVMMSERKISESSATSAAPAIRSPETNSENEGLSDDPLVVRAPPRPMLMRELIGLPCALRIQRRMVSTQKTAISPKLMMA